MARVSVSRVVDAPQGEVWKAISDIPNARRWNRAWTNIELMSSQRHGIGTRFRAHTENGDAFDFEISEWSAPDTISFTPIRKEGEGPYSITLESHTFRLEPVGDDQTLVELSARARARGLRGRFISLFFWPGYQKEGLQAALDAVAEIFEVPINTADEEPDSEE